MNDINDREITLSECKSEIDNYLRLLHQHLQTGVVDKFIIKQFMRTHACIYNLSDREADMSQRLYEYYQSILKRFLEQNVLPKLELKVTDSNQFLMEVVHQWRQYSIFTYSNTKIFEYLDRGYIKHQSQVVLSDLALHIYKRNIFEGKKAQLRAAILDQIQKDRNDELVDKELIKRAVQ